MPVPVVAKPSASALSQLLDRCRSDVRTSIKALERGVADGDPGGGVEDALARLTRLRKFLNEIPVGFDFDEASS